MNFRKFVQGPGTPAPVGPTNPSSIGGGSMPRTMPTGPATPPVPGTRGLSPSPQPATASLLGNGGSGMQRTASIRGAGGLPIENFTAWLSREDDNPTDYPKRWGTIHKTAGWLAQRLGNDQKRMAEEQAKQRAAEAAAQRVNTSRGQNTGSSREYQQSGVFGVKGGSYHAPKTAADIAVESVLAKYAGPHGKNAVRVPLSKGTRFKKLKDRLSKKKGR